MWLVKSAIHVTSKLFNNMFSYFYVIPGFLELGDKWDLHVYVIRDIDETKLTYTYTQLQ